MRPWLLLMLAVVTACETQYGAYVEVDGEIAFDRIEFHFGKQLGTAVPSSPKHLAVTPGLLYKRLFVEPDVQPVGDRTRPLTYYLPPDADNEHVGEYLIAVAYRGDTPVGIGELSGFSVPANEVWLFHIALVDVANEDAEVWGDASARCVRWARVREDAQPASTLAVVPSDDEDCDGFPDAIDCEALEYCNDATGVCLGKAGCLLAATCEIGACTNRRNTGTAMQCAPTACLSDTVCTACRGTPDFLACLMVATFTHIEIDLPRRQASMTLCTPSYTFVFALPGTKPCTSPRLELPVGGIAPDMFRIEVKEEVGGCRFTITEPVMGAQFVGNAHVLLSIADNVATTGRSTILLGLRPSARMCAQGTDVPTPIADYGTCN